MGPDLRAHVLSSVLLICILRSALIPPSGRIKGKSQDSSSQFPFRKESTRSRLDLRFQERVLCRRFPARSPLRWAQAPGRLVTSARFQKWSLWSLESPSVGLVHKYMKNWVMVAVPKSSFCSQCSGVLTARSRLTSPGNSYLGAGGCAQRGGKL